MSGRYISTQVTGLVVEDRSVNMPWAAHSPRAEKIACRIVTRTLTTSLRAIFCTGRRISHRSAARHLSRPRRSGQLTRRGVAAQHPEHIGEFSQVPQRVPCCRIFDVPGEIQVE
jgi:hypothetical protein